MAARWIQEHGAEYRVPVRITALVRAKTLKDFSQSNDVGPRFETADGERSIIVDHPIAARREAQARYTVYRTADGKPLYQGGDVSRAVSALLGIRRKATRPASRRKAPARPKRRAR